MSNYVKKYFTEADIKAIGDAIRAVEENTSGEIRVVIRQQRTWRERKQTLENIARAEFLRLGMDKTQQRTGVLILVILRDRQLYIFADEGIYSKIDQASLAVIAQDIVKKFSSNDYRGGILEGIQRVGNILAQHFPKQPNDANELPNDVVVR